MTPPIPDYPALFLDVDGTLLPISLRPGPPRPTPELLRLLERLSRALHGALALLSGRTLATLVELFKPLSIPAAGTHGLEIRFRDGAIQRRDSAPPVFNEARRELEVLARDDPGLYLEDKENALAIHYRASPDRADELRQSVNAIARRLGPDYHVQEGLYVLELKPAGINKGTALRQFMESHPFLGRTPIAVGDDLTDLHAFAQAEMLGGFGVAIGDRIAARWQITDPATLHHWLENVIRRSNAIVWDDGRPFR